MIADTTEGSVARQTKQARALREARARLNVTTGELATLLGVSLPTLRNWIAPKTSKMHREMPLTAKLLLERILTDRRPGPRK